MLKAALHITLSLTLFISSTGIPVIKHLCHNQVQMVTAFVEPEGCSGGDRLQSQNSGRKAEDSGCCSHQSFEHNKQKDCCGTDTHVVKIPDIFNANPPKQLNLPDFNFIVVKTVFLSLSHLRYESQTLESKYNVPLLIQDIPVLIVSFLE